MLFMAECCGLIEPHSLREEAALHSGGMTPKQSLNLFQRCHRLSEGGARTNQKKKTKAFLSLLSFSSVYVLQQAASTAIKK